MPRPHNWANWGWGQSKGQEENCHAYAFHVVDVRRLNALGARSAGVRTDGSDRRVPERLQSGAVQRRGPVHVTPRLSALGNLEEPGHLAHLC